MSLKNKNKKGGYKYTYSNKYSEKEIKNIIYNLKEKYKNDDISIDIKDCLRPLENDEDIEFFCEILDIPFLRKKNIIETKKHIIKEKEINFKYSTGKIFKIARIINEKDEGIEKHIQYINLKDIDILKHLETNIEEFCKIFNITIDKKEKSLNELKKDIYKQKKQIFDKYPYEMSKICSIISSGKYPTKFDIEPIRCLDALKRVEECKRFGQLMGIELKNEILEDAKKELLHNIIKIHNYKEIDIIAKSITDKKLEYVTSAIGGWERFISMWSGRIFLFFFTGGWYLTLPIAVFLHKKLSRITLPPDLYKKLSSIKLPDSLKKKISFKKH